MTNKIINLDNFKSLDYFIGRDYLLGVISSVIDSFKHNLDLRIFLKETFSLEYKDYVFKSKTTVISRVVRDLKKSIGNKNEAFENYRSLIFFLNSSYSKSMLKEDTYSLFRNQKRKKRRNSNETLKDWMEGFQ